MRLSQDEIAGLIGASRESVARALASLRARGLVATGRRAIRILDPDALHLARRVAPRADATHVADALRQLTQTRRFHRRTLQHMEQTGEAVETRSKRPSMKLAVVGLLFAVMAAGCAVTRGTDGGSAVPTPTGRAAAGPVVATAPATSAVTAVVYGPLPEQVLDVHLPTTGAGPFPVMIYVHGGGWIAGDRSVIPDFVLAQVGRGIAVISIDYRLVTTALDGSFVNTFPVPVTDVDRAVRFVKAHASAWNLDPEHVMLAGASAGGHLAALAAAAPGVFVDSALPADLAAVSPRAGRARLRGHQ